MPSAYLLVSHGSRDPRPEIALQQLIDLIAKKQHNSLDNSEKQNKLLGLAYLETRPEPLHIQIKEFAHSAVVAGCDSLKIIPLFLLPGVHVMQEIPEEVELAQQAIGEDISIELLPYLGSQPNLPTLLSKQMADITTQAWILLAHGSRRPGSQQPVENIAANLGAVAAYWSVPPNLAARVEELVTAGKMQIAILPYFLFAGGITDAIAQVTEELKLKFPAVTFQLAQPLGASAELADLIWDLMNE
ncbi:sirohydrochlorin chelatase [Nostoc sp. FACHB-152]|uniref:sirohydrochlorin chelatase n=1 Tax=unclassified Nostoc TaxID=2593658 RepID=UPI001689647F|nr:MULTISPECIES: sirohydrochlorin chelatase [unclassified Nostoc]MBD2448152.1 sirohydrochlorin chelatase [Nostoc sp. FACHB-152]MBD2470571.1 sirohydrochlorin chelatase [Nostoc sp. FACHB-145]